MEEPSLDSSKRVQQPTKQKGGLRTMPFIIANEAFERVASHGLMPNMILYLMRGYHMDVATGTSVLSLWGAATNFLPLLGAFISDSVLGKYPTIVLGSFASLSCIGATKLDEYRKHIEKDSGFGKTFSASKSARTILAKIRKLEDLTIGPVLTLSARSSTVRKDCLWLFVSGDSPLTSPESTRRPGKQNLQ